MTVITIIRRKLVIGLILLACLFAAGSTIPAVAQPDFDGICDGVRYTSGTGCDPPGNTISQNTLNRTIRNVINIFSGIIGIVAVFMIIMAGYRYITAGGDSNRISSAQQSLIYAIVGLIVVAMSQVIARFALQQLG